MKSSFESVILISFSNVIIKLSFFDISSFSLSLNFSSSFTFSLIAGIEKLFSLTGIVSISISLSLKYPLVALLLSVSFSFFEWISSSGVNLFWGSNFNIDTQVTIGSSIFSVNFKSNFVANVLLFKNVFFLV